MKSVIQLYRVPGHPDILKTCKGKKVRIILKNDDSFILIKKGRRMNAPILIDGVIRYPVMCNGRPVYDIFVKERRAG